MESTKRAEIGAFLKTRISGCYAPFILALARSRISPILDRWKKVDKKKVDMEKGRQEKGCLFPHWKRVDWKKVDMEKGRPEKGCLFPHRKKVAFFHPGK